MAKLFIVELGTGKVVSLFEQTGDRQRIFSAITPLEVRSALQRRCRRGDLTMDDVKDSLAILADEMRRTLQMPITQPLLHAAQDLVDSFPLRAADAIQLASALAFAEAEPELTLIFVSADKALSNAAAGAGLETLDPTEFNPPAAADSGR